MSNSNFYGYGMVLERRCSHCGGVDRFAAADETDHCGTCGGEAYPVSTWVCDREHAAPRCGATVCHLGGSQKVSTTTRPERVVMPPAEETWGHILEMFELGDGPLDSGPRHCVWLHKLRAGGYRWRCSCGARQDYVTIGVALFTAARGHFEQPWEPAAVPVGSPLAIWNDRVNGDPPPSLDDLERLVQEFAEEEADVTPIRPRGAPVEVVHLCGLCGKTFRIAEDDPHWSTGRGPICPPPTETLP
jgi:hypothetical protein